ncbi:hypothetical protein ACFORG_20390 [Lutimaribacter marinistellae]|uniref:Uncharacterized protein n=1 Tax=Lutimaribacter marinistellae TaxID=1820329 RepID=A0ABV7TKF4_9RHOB
MFDFPSTPSPLHVFVQDHFEAVQNASFLLGGPAWLKRTQRLIDAVSRTPHVTRKMRAEAQVLYELLTLEHVHDFDREEGWYFDQLDLEAPYIAEICVLTEALAEVIEAVGCVHGQAGRA